MDRRELLKAILPVAAAPVMVKGQEVGKAFKLDPNARYEVFINGHLVDWESFCKGMPNDQRGLPPYTPVHIVYPHGDQTMDDVIRIYEVK